MVGWPNISWVWYWLSCLNFTQLPVHPIGMLLKEHSSVVWAYVSLWHSGFDHGLGDWWQIVWVRPQGGVVMCRIMLVRHNIQLVKMNLWYALVGWDQDMFLRYEREFNYVLGKPEFWANGGHRFNNVDWVVIYGKEDGISEGWFPTSYTICWCWWCYVT